MDGCNKCTHSEGENLLGLLSIFAVFNQALDTVFLAITALYSMVLYLVMTSEIAAKLL